MRTISEPASASSATWAAVAAASAVSVFVIDCTTTGAPAPTVTSPTRHAREILRSPIIRRTLAERRPACRYPTDASPATG